MIRSKKKAEKIREGQKRSNKNKAYLCDKGEFCMALKALRR